MGLMEVNETTMEQLNRIPCIRTNITEKNDNLKTRSILLEL